MKKLHLNYLKDYLVLLFLQHYFSLMYKPKVSMMQSNFQISRVEKLSGSSEQA